MKRFSMILVVLAAAAFLSSCAPAARPDFDRIAARGEIVVGVKGDTPPFGFRAKDNELWGFDVDLARSIAKRLGVQPKFVPVTTAERIPALLNGTVDMLVACMTITRERARMVDFSMPYFETHQALLVRADSTVTDYLDLAGRNVGAVKGSTGMATLAIVQPDAVIVPCDNYTDARNALAAGEIEALATDYMILAGLVAGTDNAFRIVGRFGWEPYGIAIRPDESKLRSRIDEILQDLWDEGDYQRIYDNWFGVHGRFPTETTFSITTYPRGNLAKPARP